MAVRVLPSRCRSAIVIRSASVRYRTDDGRERRSQGLHSGIVQPLAGPVDDRSPVPPARPGTPVHADDPTGLRVGHPLLDQTYELLTLPRKNIPPMMPIALFHHVHRTPRSISALRRSLESTTSRWGQCKSSLRIGPRLLPVFARDYPVEYLGDTVEALVEAARAGFRVGEVPVTMVERQGGAPSTAGLAASWYTLRVLIVIALRWRRRTRAPVVSAPV